MALCALAARERNIPIRRRTNHRLVERLDELDGSGEPGLEFFKGFLLIGIFWRCRSGEPSRRAFAKSDASCTCRASGNMSGKSRVRAAPQDRLFCLCMSGSFVE